MKNLRVGIILVLTLLAVGPLHAGKNAWICLIPSVCGGGPNSDPPPPIPDPPPEIGQDPTMYKPNGVEPDDLSLRDAQIPAGPSDPGIHAFSMIADSRTHLAHASYPLKSYDDWGGQYGDNWKKDWSHWDQMKLLGQYRTACSGERRQIHNAAFSGTWARFWAREYIWVAGPGLSNRVVVMAGGNDVIGRAGEYANAMILPFVGYNIRLQTTGDIHGYVKKLVQTLAFSGREVIVQRHFMSNPGMQRDYVDAGLSDLNDFAYRDFGPEAYQIIPFRWKLVWTLKWVMWRIGRCPFCFFIPILRPMPHWEFVPPKIIWTPKMAGVSFAQIRNRMPSSYFLNGDFKHLNHMGYQLHAADLRYALWERCWW